VWGVDSSLEGAQNGRSMLGSSKPFVWGGFKSCLGAVNFREHLSAVLLSSKPCQKLDDSAARCGAYKLTKRKAR
jgi:hypothetical protein